MPDDLLVQVSLAEPSEAVGQSFAMSRLRGREHGGFTLCGEEPVAIKRDGVFGEIGGGGYDAIGGTCFWRRGGLAHLERYEDAIRQQFGKRLSAGLLDHRGQELKIAPL